MTTREYWREIRAIAAKFDPEAFQRDREEEDLEQRVHLKRSEKPVWLTSLENREKASVGGKVLLMKPYAAAERIFAQTHREAKPDEIEVEQERQAAERVRILKEDAAAKQLVTTNVTVNSKEIGEAVAAAMENQKPARVTRAQQPAS